MNNLIETNAIKTENGLLLESEEHYFVVEMFAKEDGYHNIDIGYAHDDWEAYVRIDITHEDGEEHGFMQGLLHGKNQMTLLMFLKAGRNLVKFRHHFKSGTHIFYVKNSGKTNKLSYEISPKNDILFLDKPKKIRTFIKNYREKLEKIESASGIDIGFEYFQKDKTNGFLAAMIDVYPNPDDILKLGEGEHTLFYTLESGKVLKQKLTIKNSAGNAKLKYINFDVGQANSTLVFLPNDKKMLIDSGTEAMAKERVIPYLEKHKIKIDYYLITHFHKDHQGLKDKVFELNKINKPDEKKVQKLIKKDKKRRYAYLKRFGYLDSSMLCCYDEIDKIWDLGGVKMEAANSRYDENGNPKKEYHYSFVKNNEHNFENSTSVSFMLEFNGFRYYHSADNYGFCQERYMSDMIKMGREDELSCQWFYANHHFINDINAKFINTLNPVGVYVPNNMLYRRAAYSYYYKENVVNYYFSHKRLKDTLVSAEVGNVRVCVNNADDWYYEILQNENL